MMYTQATLLLDNDIALDLLMESLPIFMELQEVEKDKRKHSYNLGLALKKIGELYIKKHDTSNALIYLEKSLSHYKNLLEKYNNDYLINVNIAQIYSNKAIYLINIDKNNINKSRTLWSQSYNYFKQALKIKNSESFICNEWKKSLVLESEALQNNIIELRALWNNAKIMLLDLPDISAKSTKDFIAFVDEKIASLSKES